jgi:hypothetical protein
MDNVPLGCFLLGVFLTVIIGLPIMLKFALHQFEEGIEFGMEIGKAKERYNTHSDPDEETEE